MLDNVDVIVGNKHGKNRKWDKNRNGWFPGKK